MLQRNETGWSNPKVLGVLAVVFLCGAVFGAAGMREFVHHRMRTAVIHEPALVYRGQRVGLSQMKQQLSLTPSQEETVSRVLDDYAKFYQNIDDQRETVVESSRQRILDVLQPEQRRTFEEMFVRRRRP